MSQYGYKFKGKYFILGAIGILGVIFTESWIQIIFGIYTFGCIIGIIKGD
jgi:hypothetical protein